MKAGTLFILSCDFTGGKNILASIYYWLQQLIILFHIVFFLFSSLLAQKSHSHMSIVIAQGSNKKIHLKTTLTSWKVIQSEASYVWIQFVALSATNEVAGSRGPGGNNSHLA